MKTNTLFNKENLFIVLLLLFSLSINQYYGNRGIFPTDSFSHFDTGFRILLGEHPFRDYWIVSGPFVDYIQAFIFYLLGVSWQTYVFHASIINAILTILTFLILKNFKLNIFYCFIYSLFFSILSPQEWSNTKNTFLCPNKCFNQCEKRIRNKLFNRQLDEA